MFRFAHPDFLIFAFSPSRIGGVLRVRHDREEESDKEIR